MSAATLTAPTAMTKTAIQEVLTRKNIPFTTKMTKDQLWSLTKQSEPVAEIGRSSSGEY